MKYIYLFTIGLLLGLTSCQSLQENATEPKAREAAQWIKDRSGFIQNAVQAITHVAVYATEKDSHERARTLEIMNAVSGNLHALIVSGEVNPTSIQNALKIDEPYFGPLFASISLLIHTELKKAQDNGYTELSTEILIAVTQGIKSGTVQ
jgi:hypothetical protein